jgi:hypothetical protein
LKKIGLQIHRLQPAIKSGVGFGFAEAGDAVAGLPLAAFFENFDAFKPFHDIALGPAGAGCAQTSML